MGHVNAAIEQQCRICKATAPKEIIKEIKREQAEFFLINYNSNEKICTNCVKKYNVFKTVPFEEVKANFGFAIHETVEDVSSCQPGHLCSYCFEKQRWRSDVESIPKKEDRIKAEKTFFKDKIKDGCPTVALTPLKINKKLVENIYRVEYRLKKRDWTYCKPCDVILSYAGSNNTSVNKHLKSKNHLECTEKDYGQGPIHDAPIQSMVSKEITNEQMLECRQILVEEFGAKLSIYYLTSPNFENAIRRLFAVFGLHLPPDRSLTGSRRTMQRMIKNKADQIKKGVTDDLAVAQVQNSHLVISTDDGSLSHGNRENYRTFNVTWVDPTGQVNSRYLTSWDDLNKKADDLKESLDRVKKEFEIATNNYSLCTDGASTNKKLAELDDNRQLNLCGPHGLNNSADCGVKEMSNRNDEFKELNRLIKDFSSKGSRKKYNQRFAMKENWIKLKSISNTRWDSLCIVLEAIIVNYDILKDNNVDHLLLKNYPKEFLQEYHSLLVPLREANQSMQLTTRTSGHLVAAHYHNCLVHFLEYSSIATKPPVMKSFAQQLAQELIDRIDNTYAITRKQHRVNLDRLLQCAFYPGSCFLSIFERKMTDPGHQELIDNRINIYKQQIQKWAKDKANQSSMSESLVMNISQTPLEFEIQSYIQLVRRLEETTESTPLPQVLIDFKQNVASNKDANAMFWASEYVQQHLPHLRAEIIKLLPIPASTSLCEGTFSVANQIRTAKRSLITATNLDNFLTCHYARLLCPQNYTS